ncbi:hypothetical protein LU298_08110 [Komagataeibacter intermedius]|uniref:hypothetical protein n=1 Tax=Komagataeibacter intermedius TaxID=66229 RepID=UPI000A8A879C|nr:hypothetical protein [Komagataeibacter intermedius]MCF3636466.1 hypothetical protein [Komagataeibacter intermedius]
MSKHFAMSSIWSGLAQRHGSSVPDGAGHCPDTPLPCDMRYRDGNAGGRPV